MLALEAKFRSNFVFKVWNTPDNFTLADRFYCERVHLLVQGRQFAAPASGDGRYATEAVISRDRMDIPGTYPRKVYIAEHLFIRYENLVNEWSRCPVSFVYEHVYQGPGKRPRQCCHPSDGNAAEGQLI